MTVIHHVVRKFLSDPYSFSRLVLNRPLRRYQVEPARTITRAVIEGKGGTFAVIMSRQAGKNETAAQLEAYLLNLYQRAGGQMVKASPTFKPQTMISMTRLMSMLDNPWNRTTYRREQGYIIRLGNAFASFFSAEPSANVVGATASILLEGDESQDIEADKWNKDFKPMAASTNAVSVLWGTAWTSQTLLAKTIASLPKDHIFKVPWDRVAEEVPLYGAYVQGEIARLGPRHPLIRTQYMLEEIDQEAGMFPNYRQALMHGDHPRQQQPQPNRIYALLIDVAGEETEPDQPNPLRDSTAVTIVEIDLTSRRDPCLRLPTYRVQDRRQFQGISHTALYANLASIADAWHALYIVVDSTGIGHGLSSFLRARLGEDRLIPFVFSRASKSQLGYDFIALIDTGRYKDYANDLDEVTRLFWMQVDECQLEIMPGPGHIMRWSVPDAALHDDLLISASLCAVLDSLPWPLTGISEVIKTPDPLTAIDKGAWQ